MPRKPTRLILVLTCLSAVAASVDTVRQLWQGRPLDAVIPIAVLLLCVAVAKLLDVVEAHMRR